MMLLSSINEEKRRELQRDVEYQTERLKQATDRALSAIRTDLSIGRWLRQYPIESAILMILGGVALSQILQRRAPGLEIPEEKLYSDVA